MRKYEVIWERIKNADPEKFVCITVTNQAMIQTIINMVKLEKSRAQIARKGLDLPCFGKLEIDRSQPMRVGFRLSNNGDV